ncbi:MAG: recombination factor protein RarA, partial [Halieaceae bacterium]
SDIDIAPSLIPKLANAADGDGRRVCALLELAADLAPRVGDRRVIDDSILSEIATGSLRRFDKGGDAFYDQISALHKSVRGSAPDASLYWFARLLDGGCDPIYIARRVVRIASEDIGNADPRALELALNAWQVQERLGSPEGELAIAQAITYAACAAKSNAVYVAYKRARGLAEKSGSLEVPLHLRNAPTALMEAEGYGDGYRYDHEEPDGFSAGQTYFPEGLDTHPLYEPVNRGLESKIAEKLAMLRERVLATGKKS